MNGTTVGLALLIRAVVAYIHKSLFCGDWEFNMFLHTCGVNQFCIIVFLASVNPANYILFCK